MGYWIKLPVQAVNLKCCMFKLEPHSFLGMRYLVFHISYNAEGGSCDGAALQNNPINLISHLFPCNYPHTCPFNTPPIVTPTPGVICPSILSRI